MFHFPTVLVAIMGGSVCNVDRAKGKDTQNRLGNFLMLWRSIFNYSIKVVEICLKDSRDIAVKDRAALVQALGENEYTDVSQVLVFHGKVTAVETAIYLSQAHGAFADKVILVIWSDRMLSEAMSDGPSVASYALGVLSSGILPPGVYVLADGGGIMLAEEARYEQDVEMIVGLHS